MLRRNLNYERITFMTKRKFEILQYKKKNVQKHNDTYDCNHSTKI